MKIKTIQQAEKACKELDEFYTGYINQAIETAGGLRRLSDKIGIHAGALTNVLKRNSFSALRRLSVKIDKFEND